MNYNSKYGSGTPYSKEIYIYIIYNRGNCLHIYIPLLHMGNRYRTNTDIKWSMILSSILAMGLGAITDYLVTD